MNDIDVVTYFKQRIETYKTKSSEEFAAHSASIETCNKYGVRMEHLEEILDKAEEDREQEDAIG